MNTVSSHWRHGLLCTDLSIADSTLLQVSKVTALPKPYKQHLALLRDSLNEKEDGSSFLSGSEFLTWEGLNEKDLIAVNTSTDEDEFTHWFNTHPLKWYHWLVGSRSEVSGPREDVESVKVQR